MIIDHPPFLSVGGIGGIRTEETSKKKLVIESALLKKKDPASWGRTTHLSLAGVDPYAAEETKRLYSKLYPFIIFSPIHSLITFGPAVDDE